MQAASAEQRRHDAAGVTGGRVVVSSDTDELE